MCRSSSSTGPSWRRYSSEPGEHGPRPGDAPGSPAGGRLRVPEGASEEFVGGIRTDETGRFQFYAAPGAWTLDVQAVGSRLMQRLTLKRDGDQLVTVEA
ncbi:MAG: DUF1416 domain-containing protein [Chloroflexi bacterium]|nr:MAG: DUF1416 domain-containing protein [Chloroflexota bacterium]